MTNRGKCLSQNYVVNQCTAYLPDDETKTLLQGYRRPTDIGLPAPEILRIFGSHEKRPTEERDGESSMIIEWKNLVYLRVGCVFIMAVVDIVTAYVFQIFWLDSDFVCRIGYQDDTSNVGKQIPTNVARPDIIMLFVLIICLHVLRMVSAMCEPPLVECTIQIADSSHHFAGFLHGKNRYGGAASWIPVLLQPESGGLHAAHDQ